MEPQIEVDANLVIQLLVEDVARLTRELALTKARALTAEMTLAALAAQGTTGPTE